MAANAWASPSGSQDDAFWRRPETPEGRPEPSSVAPPVPSYQKPPPMHRSTAQVGWGPLIRQGPAPRLLPPQDHDALDQEEAQARAVTVGVGVFTLIVLFLLLLMVVIRAGTAGASL